MRYSGINYFIVFCVGSLCALFLTVPLQVMAQGVSEEHTPTIRIITGYYYDPETGDILPKYDELSPDEVRGYLAYIKGKKDNPPGQDKDSDGDDETITGGGSKPLGGGFLGLTLP